MTKVILIITDEYDSHADAVLLELKRRGATVFRFHPDDVPTGYKISIEIENGILQGEISNEYRGVSLKDIQSVWYRGTRVLFPKKRGIVDRSIQEYIALQSHEIVKALYKMIDASWISHPEKLMFAEIKALQLFKAYHAGLCVPATLFSNDPMKTASFIGKLGEAACAIKPITLEGVTSKDGYRFPLTKILPDNYPLDSVVYAPSIFQPYIPKIADLRCVVIGEKIFCAKILSQANDETKLDWRGGDCNYEPFILPLNIQASIRRLMRDFDIQFASLDMVLTRDENFMFLELNPNGQWLWLEYELGFPLVATMADLLMNPVSIG